MSNAKLKLEKESLVTELNAKHSKIDSLIAELKVINVHLDAARKESPK